MRRPCRTFGSRFATSCCGIGGFRSGLEKAGGYECVGFCEIDKNAEIAYRAMYDTEKEVFYNDITKINAEEMPDFDLFVGGFPCQPYPAKKVIPKNDIKAHKAECLNYKLRNNQTRIKAVQKV